ncbi:MAG: UvrD-helicase domain-containing protein [Thiogranum sp.]
MTDTPLATQPDRSFSVIASAGTGKTWQLVARLTRLLLHGVRLDSILAITFTRKAAGEMQQRLNQRLRELLEADDRQLDQALADIGASPAPALRRQARMLFESTLRSEQNLRSTTFHSFCQELLQRFPLEAGLPPGFELVEQTGLLLAESWDALFAEATAAPGQPPAQALDTLFDSLNGLHNTRNALFAFVEHRSDWWAFTQQDSDPAAAATAYLRRQLETGQQDSVVETFWDDATRDRLGEFAGLLGRHATQTNLKFVASIEAILDKPADTETAIRNIQPLFFTTGGERRKRAEKNTQCRAMGESGQARFLALHEWFCEQLEQITEAQNRRRTLAVNSAWYRAGQRMLELYQRIKRERRLLDFTDLEWNAYRLLNHPEHAHWIQYKLDQRIDHLLIDEFQDTNPTQWRLILPLLEEMAAGSERLRSLFVVGDAKQSIYRFRRGTPRLLGIASEWMQQRLDAGSINLDRSWRSSPAVIDCVNWIFQHPEMEHLLTDFKTHSTHRQELWGRVELWPLIEAEAATEGTDTPALRNPLQEPRTVALDSRHYREGQAIAARIRELVEQQIADYNDILILMRSRTHLADYEAALRDSGIPYLSLDRGSLLQSLEIRDLEALLIVLMTPQDNLALAQILRSPVFSVSDDDLMLLARTAQGPWIERLDTVCKTLANDHPLVRARRLLGDWRALAGHVPIHDLLERIFHQANLMQRYRAAFPATQVARVHANLTRFIELALEIDAGRYPTLPRFLDHVRQLRNLEKEGPNQATPQSEQNQRVCLLTIHAAKGLEAPVVFLADSTNRGSSPPGSQTLVRWPAEADRPADFMLLSNSKLRDSISNARYALEQEEEQRESANLLYVALTRARSMLVISGCAPSSRNGSTGWYGQIATALCDDPLPAQAWIHTFGEPAVKGAAAGREAPEIDVDTRLGQPFSVTPVRREIAPSHSVDETGFETAVPGGRIRGLIIHRMLQLATQEHTGRDILQRLAGEFCLAENDPGLQHCWREVETLLNKAELAWLFKPAGDVKAWNEVPIQYVHEQQTVYGIIDRLVVRDRLVHLVDYKTHRLGDESRIQQLASVYRPQMDLYREGVRRLWPDHRVNTYLLLTDNGLLVKMEPAP